MLHRLGIGGRLFLAFAGIMGLSLISGLVGWLELREVAGIQKTITGSTLPAAIEARGLAEASARLVARSPRLTDAGSEAERAAQAEALFAEADALRGGLDELGRAGFAPAAIAALQGSVERMIENLRQQDALVGRRLALGERSAAALADASDAAAGLYDLSETLVSNAAAGTSAVISNLYDLVEDPEGTEPAMQALDRLVESDIYMMERMFELRLRSSQIGLLFNQLPKATSGAEIAELQDVLDRDLQIITWRVAGIADPVRRVQAEALLTRLTASNAADRPDNPFALGHAILETVAEIERLADVNRQLANELSGQVVGLVEASRSVTAQATQRAERAVGIGLVTLLALTLASLVAATLIIWLYVRGNVVTRLRYLAGRMTELARGNLAVEVKASGSDELTEMARTIQYFKEEAVRKRELEVARDAAEAELRRHKEELEELVQERTAQLSDANARLKDEVARHDEARARAEQASRAKSEFLATMSHEIRTPMNGMLGMAKVLGEGQLTAAQREQLNIVETSGEALLGLLNDILDYSKIESGHIQIEERDFALRELVDGILCLMGPRAREKGIALEVGYGPGVPEVLRGDSGKLRQILFNLIGNGIKFTDRGTVGLDVALAANGDPALSRLRFVVADSGIGLPADRAEQVFEAFTQLDSSVSRHYGGTGLGLAICKKLVTALGGRIGVEGRAGGGSRFWFDLTFAAGDPTAVDREAATERPGATEDLAPQHILVVEDNEVNRLVAQSFLEAMGHRVSLASDGHQALAAVAESDFDAVLMDISLPGLDGVSATRRIRANPDPAKRALPIIAMSAHVFTSEVDEHLQAGMDGFIGKPMSPERLAQVLSEVLQGRDRRPIASAAPSGDDPLRNARAALAGDLAIIGPERTGRMVELFLETTPARVRELDKAVRRADCAGAGFAAHNLRNAAGSLGLPRLAERLAALEAAATAGRQEELSRLHAGFAALYDESTALLSDAWRDLQA